MANDIRTACQFQCRQVVSGADGGQDCFQIIVGQFLRNIMVEFSEVQDLPARRYGPERRPWRCPQRRGEQRCRRLVQERRQIRPRLSGQRDKEAAPRRWIHPPALAAAVAGSVGCHGRGIRGCGQYRGGAQICMGRRRRHW